MKSTAFAFIAVLLVLFSGVALSDEGEETEPADRDDSTKRNDLAKREEQLRRLAQDAMKKDFVEKVAKKARENAIDMAKEEIKNKLAEKARIEIRAKMDGSIEEMRLKLRMQSDANSEVADKFRKELQTIKLRLEKSTESKKREIRSELRVKASQTLGAELDTVLSKILLLKEQENPPEGLDEAIEFLEEKKARLNDANATQETIIEVSRETREFWTEYNTKTKRKIGHEVNEKYTRILVKAKAVLVKLAATIEGLKAEGKDTAILERAQTKLDSDISALEVAAEKIKAEYAQADSRREVKESLSEAHQLLRASHRQLQKDFILIRLMLKATNQLAAGNAISADVAAEIEAVSAQATEEIELEVAQEELEDNSKEQEDPTESADETESEAEIDASQEGDVNA